MSQASIYLSGAAFGRKSTSEEPSGYVQQSAGSISEGEFINSHLWRNSARMIVEIVILSDVISPDAYCALPFVNQAFFVAASCYVKGKGDLSSRTVC